MSFANISAKLRVVGSIPFLGVNIVAHPIAAADQKKNRTLNPILDEVSLN